MRVINSTWEKLPATLRSHLPSTLATLVVASALGYLLREVVINTPSDDRATMISGFGGAAVGAVLGGGISWLLANQTARDTLARDVEARRDADKAAAFRFSTKVVVLANELETIVAHVENAISAAAENNLLYNEDHSPKEIWQFVRPTPVSKRPQIAFDAADFQPLMNVGRFALANRAMELAAQLDALQSAFEAYGPMRREMNELLAPHMQFDFETGISSAQVGGQQRFVIQARAYEMDHLLGEIIDLGGEYRSNATKLCDDIAEAFRSNFGKGFPIISAKTPSSNPSAESGINAAPPAAPAPPRR